MSSKPAPKAPAQPPTLRPPSVPLVVCDPYLSVWSAADKLTAEWSRHWTGAHHPICGMLRVDRRTLRFAGPEPSGAAEMTQTALAVHPTRTVYDFADGQGTTLRLTFTTPLLPHDLDLLSRPVTYVSFEVTNRGTTPRNVSLYLDVTGEWAVNRADQQVVWSRCKIPGLDVLAIGSQEQNVLGKSGDDLRIDWGHLYLAAPEAPTSGVTMHMGSQECRTAFAKTGRLPDADDLDMPRRACDRWPTLACAFDLGKVKPGQRAGRHVILAYDDVFSLTCLDRRLRPYWRRNGMGAADLLAAAEADYRKVTRMCAQFDEELCADLRATGGTKYEQVASLAFRQCIAAHKLAADFDGTPIFFSKENFSNGCIDTVDVTYPSSPFFLLFNAELLKAQLTPILDYAASPRWTFPFAPHDLGTYPLANGQVYGGGERTEENQMPVEECGNMLIMIGALAWLEGNADYAARHWETISEWGDYLRAKGFDPENQLCTDDFAGHLAHNTNLSIKAILGLGCYAMLGRMLGKKESAAVRREAEKMAARWVREAADGVHFRLTFDKPGTWSQKYNLVWDRLLGLDLFPADVAAKEVASYLGKQNRYGLPLDSRSAYTKLDWIAWTATMAAKRRDFDTLMDPLHLFLNESPSRVPMTDWYWTTDGRQVGFQARSVVGGVFIAILANAALRRKWHRRATA